LQARRDFERGDLESVRQTLASLTPEALKQQAVSRGDDRSMADLNAIRSILLGLTRPTCRRRRPENLVKFI